MVPHPLCLISGGPANSVQCLLNSCCKGSNTWLILRSSAQRKAPLSSSILNLCHIIDFHWCHAGQSLRIPAASGYSSCYYPPIHPAEKLESSESLEFLAQLLLTIPRVQLIKVTANFSLGGFGAATILTNTYSLILKKKAGNLKLRYFADTFKHQQVVSHKYFV